MDDVIIKLRTCPVCREPMPIESFKHEVLIDDAVLPVHICEVCFLFFEHMIDRLKAPEPLLE